MEFPADFAGAGDIITNLAKERGPSVIERTPESLIITCLFSCFQLGLLP